MENMSRGWVIVTSGEAGLSSAPKFVWQLSKRGEPSSGIYIDHALNALATARELDFDIVELDWRGAFAAKGVRRASAELGWEDSDPEEPQGKPRVIRKVMIANLPKVRRLLDARVREFGEKGTGELIILMIWGSCGPTSSTTALVVASAIETWKEEWKRRYPSLPIRKYGVEAIPLEYQQGNGLDANALTAYFSRLSRVALMGKKGLFDKLFIVNGPDYQPAEVDDLTLPRFSRLWADGIGHLLGLKVLTSENAVPFEYLAGC